MVHILERAGAAVTAGAMTGHFMQQKLPALAALATVAFSGYGSAEPGAIEELLVTGAYTPLPELTASLYVLDEEAIGSLNKRTLADALHTVPGLLVEQQGGPGGLTAISVRGAESNFTLVLLDGVPVNDPTNTRGGGFDFAHLNPAVVQRVEIVRGAQSAVYGSDALAGVINIVTRRPDPGHGAGFGAEWGEDDFANYHASFSGARANWDYALDIAHRDDGEPVPGSTRESDTANLRFGWSPLDGQRLQLAYRYLDGERGTYPEQSGGPLYAASDALEQSDYRDEVFSLGWTARLTAHWQSSLSASRFEHSEDLASPGIAPYLEVPPNAADTWFRRDQLQWTNSLSLGAASELVLGADYRDEEGDSAGYLDYFGVQLPTDFKLDRSTTGLFAAISSALGERLLVQASLRRDDPDGYAPETSSSIGARYQVSPGITLRANWGEAFKLPSFFALGHPLVGNPELQPETARSWDAGITWRALDGLELGVTGFSNDYQDLIDFDEEAFRNVNRKNIETSGVELQADWTLTEALGLSAQATWTDIDVKGEDTVLTGRPEWVASLVGRWEIAERWNSSLDYSYTGKQWAVSRHTGEEQAEEIDAYHRVDWVLAWAPRENWLLQLSADNLLDEDYETSIGFPGPGRSFRLGVHYAH